MNYTDCRRWLAEVEKLGELKTVDGAHWDIEIGVLSDYLCRQRNQPAVVFDHIVDYPAGYRILVNDVNSRKRLAFTLGLSTELDERALMAAWREKWKTMEPIPPREIDSGPILENVLEGDAIDMWEFPAPRWHEHDGGRYPGTGDAVITRDPDDGSINVGTYRVMGLDRSRLIAYISPGKDGRIHRDKWFARNEPMPVVIVFGSDPLLHLVAGWSLGHGVSELGYVAGIKGEPVEVITGPVTGLPIPATSEIAIEGLVMPDERSAEGPFGEWTGYYASGTREEPVVQVKRVYHRDDPILLGSPPVKPPSGKSYTRAFLRSAAIREELEESGMHGIERIWSHEAGGGRFLTVVSLQQRYPGHAKQVGAMASQSRTAAYMGRYTVVVDDDIDAMNLEDVIWAVCTRSDPAADIDILRRCWSGPLDPIISPERRERRDFATSRAVIDATRPFEWRVQFPKVSESTAVLRESVMAKWRTKLV